MCGPIAFMLHSRVPGSAWAHTVWPQYRKDHYHALLGAIAAAIGQHIAMAGLQQVLSIVKWSAYSAHSVAECRQKSQMGERDL